jgi:hypothetical protein
MRDIFVKYLRNVFVHVTGEGNDQEDKDYDSDYTENDGNDSYIDAVEYCEGDWPCGWGLVWGGGMPRMDAQINAVRLVFAQSEVEVKTLYTDTWNEHFWFFDDVFFAFFCLKKKRHRDRKINLKEKEIDQYDPNILISSQYFPISSTALSTFSPLSANSMKKT